MTDQRASSRSEWDTNFLVDRKPRPWNVDALAQRTRDLAKSAQPSTRQWFQAANGLGLALLRTNQAAAAADLMQRAIKLANDLAESDPNQIEYGLEAWLNRLEVNSQLDPDATEAGLLAAYDLVRGHPVASSWLFGLQIERLAASRPDVHTQGLSLVRNRAQAALLRSHHRRDDKKAAVSFARRVVEDYPASVRHGLLEPVEVLAQLDPRHAFLQTFSLDRPHTEGDFVLLLRQREALGLKGLGLSRFEDRLVSLEQKTTFLNPRTPLLWRVVAAKLLDEPAELDGYATSAIRACISAGDRGMYGRVRDVAGIAQCEPFGIEPMIPAAEELSGLCETLDVYARQMARHHVDST